MYIYLGFPTFGENMIISTLMRCIVSMTLLRDYLLSKIAILILQWFTIFFIPGNKALIKY